MPTRIYRSTDTSAPVLTGQAGSLLGLLGACLVDGYGALPAAGWSRAYTGTNITAYRNSIATGGTGMHVRVDDSGSGTGGAREALARAYLTMSDLNTGTIETPTVASVAASIVWRKSNTLDSAARAWIVVADELTFYLSVETGTNAPGYGAGTYSAGDFQSFLAADAHRFHISGRESQQAVGLGTAQGICASAANAFVTPVNQGFWLARNLAMAAPARAALAVLARGAEASNAIGGSSYFLNASVGLFFLPAIIANEGIIRGILRGIYISPNAFTDVAMGTNIVNPPGLASTITALRHNGTNLGAAQHDGHVHADILSSWPI